jgi:hypothetical protein
VRRLRRPWRMIIREARRAIAVLVSLMLAARLGRSGRVDWLMGWLTRQAVQASSSTSALAELNRSRILQLVRGVPTRAIVLCEAPERTSVRDLLFSVDGPELRAATSDAILRHPDVVSRSEIVYEALCLAGPEITDDQRATALMVVAGSADNLLNHQARHILTQCLDVAAQRPDPYEPPDLSFLARRAATAVLEEHPTLDDVIYDRLGTSSRTSDLEILAAALTMRPRGRPQAVTALFERWKPGPNDARRFAANVDVTRITTSRARRETVGSGRKWAVARRLAVRAGKLPLVPMVAAAIVGVTWAWHWRAAPVQLGFAEALGALAVVAAIHVVSAQLSAGRLEGILARHSTSSVSLVFSYWAAASMITASSVTGHGPRLDAALSWGLSASAAIFVIGAVAAAWSLVRQTDPSRAARLFADNRSWFYRRTGNRLGRLQARTKVFREDAGQLRFLSLVPEPVHVERRVPIVAGRRGMHIPHIRRLRHLGDRPMWSDGRLRLQILSQVGTVVSVGSELGAILPDVNSQVPQAESRRARRAFRLQRIRGIEDAAEGTGVLAAVAARLSRAGDRGGAERTGEALHRLLRVHLDAAYKARRAQTAEDEPVPVTPAFRSALEALIAHLGDSKTQTERDVLSKLLQGTLVLGRKADYGVAIVAEHMDELDSTLSPAEVAAVLRAMARECFELDDQQSLRLVEREARRRFVRGEAVVADIVDVASKIPALAGWLNQPSAPAAWRRFWASTNPLGTVVLRLRAAARVGAANLVAGSMSVAVEVVLDLRAAGVALDNLAEMLKDQQTQSAEVLRAQLGGGYLGQSSEAALSEFADFAVSVGAAICP